MPTAPEQIFILGAGGHGRVVLDVVRRAFPQAHITFVDPERGGDKVDGVPVLRGEEEAAAAVRSAPAGAVGVIAALGENALRLRVVGRYPDLPYLTAVDPSAVVSPAARLGAGSMVLPQVAVNHGTRVGRHVILNTGCTVDHDCRIGDFAHIGPGAHLAGSVQVGDGALVGVGASLAPGVTVGEGAVVGAGSVVVRDIPAGCVAFGVPARVRRRLETPWSSSI